MTQSAQTVRVVQLGQIESHGIVVTRYMALTLSAVTIFIFVALRIGSA